MKTASLPGKDEATVRNQRHARAFVFVAGRRFGIKRPMLWFCRISLLLVSLVALGGCASTASDPNGESYEPDSPALPIDPHPAQPATFTNRTDHTTSSD